MKYNFSEIVIDEQRQTKAIYKAIAHLQDRNNSGRYAFLPPNFWENVSLGLAAILSSDSSDRRQELVRNLEDMMNAYS